MVHGVFEIFTGAKQHKWRPLANANVALTCDFEQARYNSCVCVVNIEETAWQQAMSLWWQLIMVSMHLVWAHLGCRWIYQLSKGLVTSTTISQSVSMHTATYTALNFTLCTIKCETNLHCTNEQLITELTVCTIKCETNLHCTNEQLITELTVWQTLSLVISMST